jgi:hypothetical protein
LLQLEKSAHGGLFHAADAALGRGSQSECNGDRLLIVQQQRRQCRARAQLIPALHSGGGMNGISKTAQAIHITAERSSSYVEAPGQLGPGPVALSLKQREQAKQPC